jgi:hypothetical protein
VAKPRSHWSPEPHEPLLELADNLRWVRAPIPGISIKRSMTVARMRDGRLVIWSAIALDAPSVSALEAWGTPAFLIVPSALHRLDAAAYKARYPELVVLAPLGARKAVAEVVALAGSLADFPADAEVSFRPLDGIGDKEGAMLVRSADGTTVVLNDALFNMPLPRDFPSSWIVKVLGSAPGPRVSRLVKLLWCRDRPAFRASLQQLSELPELVRLIVAHDSVTHGAAARAALSSAVAQLG